MCGIVGHLSRYPLDPSEFNRMRDTLAHRGPDGKHSIFLSEGRIALGHRRLAIIDLSDIGGQPMSNENSTIWVTFNGEIYNHWELRQTLANNGKHNFKSATDTEVLIHGYEEWGLEGLVNRIKGMFAFAIWDENEQVLHLARDRFGIKPVVYYMDQDHFLFASELKAIMACTQVPRQMDEDSLADYFTYSYVPHPKTIWKNIKKLPPAHTLSFDYKSQKTDIKRYWTLETSELIVNEREAVEHINTLIHQATLQHLVSDVPIGLFLSGGYDSTTLLMHMSQLNYPTTGFTIAFPDSEENEASQAAEVARLFGAHHEIEPITRTTDVFSLLTEMSHIYDEPFAGSSMINTWLISQLAAKHSKVAFSGEGADEVFGGYKWHRKIESYYHNYNLKAFAKNIIQGNWTSKQIFLNLYNGSMLGVDKEASSTQVLNSDLRHRIRTSNLWHFSKNDRILDDPVKRSQYLDSQTFVPNHCLFRADLSSMAHSLEVRVPFLDHHIYEYVFSLQRQVYMKPGVKKFLLEENLKSSAPQSVLKMPKRGFSFHNLENIYDNRFNELLEYGSLVDSGIIKRSIDVKSLSDRFKFHLLNLELWMLNHGQKA